MAEPVGEDGWLACVDEKARTAGDIEQRVEVVELYKRAITAEPWSTKLWLAYCEWVWSLYTDCQNGDAGWPEDEQELGKQIFPLDSSLDIWQQGANATRYRLNDSHELWNRWISIELEQLPTSMNIERVRSIFLDRLQIPHATWEETSQMFSTFLTRYDERAWESTMVQVTQLAKAAKELYSMREVHELNLQRAMEAGDKDVVSSQMKEYLVWEVAQAERKTKNLSPLILCIALFERALCSTPLGLDPSVWEDYIVFLSTTGSANPSPQVPAVILVIERATNHCPWSGPLWARYILRAELENRPFTTMEQIKHAATDNRELDRDGMGSVVEFYIAWCGYLKRLTMVAGATDEDFDVADMGLPTALEDVQQWGKRRHGKEWKGDPLFRIERIFIQHLTQRGAFEEARGHWKKLVQTYADSYEFWQQYYLWEMTVRAPTGPPSRATAVLIQATNRKNLDWPEKMMEIYVRHCNNYEEIDALLKARNSVHRTSRIVAKRREQEAADAAVIYAQQQPELQAAVAEMSVSPSSTSKRKREEEDGEEGTNKKAKNAHKDAALAETAKRDRENTMVMIENIPVEATQTKVRQYFKEYGHINSITMKIEADRLSATALIEFRAPEEAVSALLRDGKYFADRQLKVTPGTGLTLFVTNFPPVADDAYLRKLFKGCGEIFSIRWPSLKHNTHRRFCYISFRTADAAAAATQLDGQSLGGVYKLSAKYSDPGNKKNREGALAEGREIHITSLDSTITEDDLKEVFGKYGKVEKAKLLKNMAGESKGAAFVSFEKPEEATAALQMDKTKLKSRVLMVEMSIGKNFKPTATSTGRASSTTPAPDGDTVMASSPAPEGHINVRAQHAPGRTEISNKTITLMNIPDTVNDARVRAIAEPFGDIVKLVLRPDHQGAIIEYSDAGGAGRAALGLENHEIVPGRKLHTGGLKGLFAQKDEIRTDRIQVGQGRKGPTPAAFIQPNAPVRRPGAGGRGGLGQKKGLEYSAPKTAAVDANGRAINGNGTGTRDMAEDKKPKSNADFKAMFLSGGRQ